MESRKACALKQQLHEPSNSGERVEDELMPLIYEELHRLAVAKMERGLCQGCRMALPTQQQQRVRNGRQTVLCNTCGRILFLS